MIRYRVQSSAGKRPNCARPKLFGNTYVLEERKRLVAHCVPLVLFSYWRAA